MRPTGVSRTRNWLWRNREPIAFFAMIGSISFCIWFVFALVQAFEAQDKDKNIPWEPIGSALSPFQHPYRFFFLFSILAVIVTGVLFNILSLSAKEERKKWEEEREHQKKLERLAHEHSTYPCHKCGAQTDRTSYEWDRNLETLQRSKSG